MFKRDYPEQNALARTMKSLEGLTIGDQFGEMFFIDPEKFQQAVNNQEIPEGAWNYTDDTEMALPIVSILAKHGQINQDELMQSFAQHHDITRGYGPSMRRVLEEVRLGANWRETIAGTFHGQGSWGNGSAMRVGPLGAFFALDLEECVKQAELSSLTTHTHPEAVAGAIATAVAAAIATTKPEHHYTEFIAEVIQHVPDSEVKSRLNRAVRINTETSPVNAAYMLGNGSDISAQDTVPFAIWCAARNLHNYEEALWNAVCAGGDRDTICAIVGSIVAMSTKTEIPAEWISRKEDGPEWFKV